MKSSSSILQYPVDFDQGPRGPLASIQERQDWPKPPYYRHQEFPTRSTSEETPHPSTVPRITPVTMPRLASYGVGLNGTVASMLGC